MSAAPGSNTPRTDIIEAALLVAREARLLAFDDCDARVVAGTILGALADGPIIEAPVIVWTRRPEAPPPDEGEGSRDEEPLYICDTCGRGYKYPQPLAAHANIEHARRMTAEERIPRPIKKDTAP